MKAAIEAVRNKEMGRYKASRVFNVAQTTLERYVKDQQKPCEAEDDIAEHCNTAAISLSSPNSLILPDGGYDIQR